MVNEIRLGCYGAYDGVNYGDELIFHVMRQRLSKHNIILTPVGLNPEKTYEIHGVRGILAPALRRARLVMRPSDRLDGVIIGGGEVFQEGKYRNPFLGLLITCYLVSLNCRVRGLPYFVYSVGLSRIHSLPSKWMLRSIISHAIVATVRDAGSHKRLMNYVGSVGAIKLSADPVFLLPRSSTYESDEVLRSFSLLRNNYVVCCPAVDHRSHNYFDAERIVSATLAEAKRRGLTVVVIPMDSRIDFDGGIQNAIERDQELSGLRFIGPDELYPLNRLVALHEGACLTVSARMHSIILAASQGTPALSINRSPKMIANSDQLSIPSVDATEGVHQESVEEAIALLLQDPATGVVDSESYYEICRRAATAEDFVVAWATSE